MASKREQAIEERRDRIFAAARDILGSEGLYGLTTRRLAEAAGVTVPTLYNIVGDKNAIVTGVIARSVESVWERLELSRRATPLDMADAVIDEAFETVRNDRAYLRALVEALVRIGTSLAANPDRDDLGARAAGRCVDMVVTACRAAQRNGQLRGNISAEELGQQMFITYRGPMRDWIEEVIDEAEMLRRQRRGFYLVLAADASDEFRAELIARLQTLTQSKIGDEAA